MNHNIRLKVTILCVYCIYCNPVPIKLYFKVFFKKRAVEKTINCFILSIVYHKGNTVKSQFAILRVD